MFKISQAESRVDVLTKQLEELHHVRHTAAEESLDHQSTHYEARIDSEPVFYDLAMLSHDIK